VEILIQPDGAVRCVYGEAIDLTALGDIRIVRASAVEPDETGRWWANLSAVGGPKLGPFSRRSEALLAEARWLSTHWLTMGPG
jgi:hypothetical protein